jgi:DNA-binding PadR family transcriptional regulator
MSLKPMILGCLLDAPSHGYEIRHRLKDFIRRSHGINEGQLYATLKKMEKDGLVTKKIEPQEKNPPRKVFFLTEKGRKEFYQWLLEGDGTDFTAFDFFGAFAFLEKCTFFKHLPPAGVAGIVESQLGLEKAKLEEFKRVRSRMLERGVNRYRIKVIEFGIDLQEIKIKWLLGLASDEPLPE